MRSLIPIHSDDNTEKKRRKIPTSWHEWNWTHRDERSWNLYFFPSLSWCRSPLAANSGAAVAECEHREKCAISGLGAQKLDTIFRHYYPETGYAYVILTLAIIVAIIIHGFHLSASVFLTPAVDRFHVDAVECIGECVWMWIISTPVSLSSWMNVFLSS